MSEPCLSCQPYIDRELQHLRAEIDLKRVDMERRLEDMNEFREQLVRERAVFLERNVYDVQHEQLRAKVESLEKSVGKVGAVAAVLGALLAILVHLIFGGGKP